MPANRTFRETFRTTNFRVRLHCDKLRFLAQSACLRHAIHKGNFLLYVQKASFTVLHMNVVGASVYKANVSSMVVFHSMALTVVSKQK